MQNSLPSIATLRPPCPCPSILGSWRKYIQRQRVFSETNPPGPDTWEPGTHLHWILDPELGYGYSAALQLCSGLCVGRCDYTVTHPFVLEHRDSDVVLRFNLMFSGDLAISVPGEDVREDLCGGDLWICTKAERELLFKHNAGGIVQGISIEVPHSMLEAWLDNATCELSRNLERFLNGERPKSSLGAYGVSPWRKSLQQRSSLMQAATRLSVAECDTVCGRICFESLALDVLSKILALDVPGQRIAPNTKHRIKAVDEAQGILNEEWASPPTISALARRVGINECYLKSGFRKRTGFSIGEYVRKLRMEKALDFIETHRCTILQAALFVGYSNPSHFSAAFKRYYGHSPSRYTAKN